MAFPLKMADQYVLFFVEHELVHGVVLDSLVDVLDIFAEFFEGPLGKMYTTPSVLGACNTIESEVTGLPLISGMSCDLGLLSEDACHVDHFGIC